MLYHTMSDLHHYAIGIAWGVAVIDHTTKITFKKHLFLSRATSAITPSLGFLVSDLAFLK